MARLGGSALVVAAIPLAVFATAFAIGYGSERRDDRADVRLLISLRTEGPLPSAAIVAVGLDGSSPKPLTHAPPGVATALDLQPDWSEDRGLLVFARERYAADGTGSAPKLYTQRGGSEPTRVTAGTDVDRSPSLSPDGRRIVFARDTNGAFELFVQDVDGSGLRQLTRDNRRLEESPAWSPDGGRIAFTSTRGEDGDLRVIKADGSGIATLTGGPPDDEAPAWSPDGSRLAFVRDGSIHVIGSDGADPRPLTTGSDRYVEPSWSPDGATIAFTSEETGALYVIGSDGSELRRVPLDGAVLPGVAWRRA